MPLPACRRPKYFARSRCRTPVAPVDVKPSDASLDTVALEEVAPSRSYFKKVKEGLSKAWRHPGRESAADSISGTEIVSTASGGGPATPSGYSTQSALELPAWARRRQGDFGWTRSGSTASSADGSGSPASPRKRWFVSTASSTAASSISPTRSRRSSAFLSPTQSRRATQEREEGGFDALVPVGGTAPPSSFGGSEAEESEDPAASPRPSETWSREERQESSGFDDRVFWEQSHRLVPGLPPLNDALPEPVVNEKFGTQHHVAARVNGGGFSDVFLVQDGKGSVRAMKAVKKSKLQSMDLVKCAANEINILKRLRHANVVQYYGAAQTMDHLILLLEFVGRLNLFQFLKHADMDRLPILFLPGMAKSFFRQMAAALEHCHGRDVTHRDIKPENFVINEAMTTVKLVDFGMSSCRRQPLMHKGTMPFAAPEVMEGDCCENYDAAAADVWSLGVVLLEMVTCVDALTKMMRWKKSQDCTAANAADLRRFLAVPGQLGEKLQEMLRPSFSFCHNLHALILGILHALPAARLEAPEVLQSPWLKVAAA